MAQEVPSLFRDSDASSASAEANQRPSHSADRDASDAAKEARVLSQLLLLFSVKRQHSAVAAMFPGHLESAADDANDVQASAAHSFSVSMSVPPTQPSVASGATSASVLDAHLHPATDAAIASSLLRSKPSERELIQQFLLLGETSRNKVAQSLFVIPPSLLNDFADILQFFLRVLLEAHSDSRQHHYESPSVHHHSHDDLDHGDAVAMPVKSCSWAQNGAFGCVEYTQDEASASSAAGGTAAAAVFTLPPGLQACLVETYGSVQRSKCEEVWHGDHMAYRCRTCGLSDSSCMCLACFDPDDHIGHDYRVYRCSSGGCCDCGDPLAWKSGGFCKRHRPQADADSAPVAEMGTLEHSVVHTLVRRVVTFCVNVLRDVYAFCLLPSGSASSSDSAQFTRSLPKTGRRRISFASIMQVRLDRLQQCLAWLQALAMSCVPYRQIVIEVFMETLPTDFLSLESSHGDESASATESRPLVVLDVFLKAGVLLPVEMCDTLGVLYLKLLFDQSFKQTYTCHFVDCYPYFIELYLVSSEESNEDGMRNLSRFIDRLFCQLFHSTAQLEELERASKLRDVQLGLVPSPEPVVNRLLSLLLKKLIGLFKSALRVETVVVRCRDESEPSQSLEPIQVVDSGRNVFKKRVYARLCSDIRTLLVHPLVAGQAILGSFDNIEGHLRLRDGDSVFSLLIEAYECLQQMDLQQRHVQHHIEFESQNWTFAFVVDYEMNLMLGSFLSGLPHCFPEDDGSDTSRSSKWDVASALIQPLRNALMKWTKTAAGPEWRSVKNGNDAVEENELQAMTQYYEAIPTATLKKSSFHLPLHHMFAALFQGVCAVVHPRSISDWKRLLFNVDQSESGVRHEELVFLYHAVDHPLRVSMFAREIKAGLWIRNGNVMWQQLVHYYAKHWRFFGVHGDLFVAQMSALMLPRGSVTRMVLRQLLSSFKNALIQGESEPVPRHEVELLEETLRFITQLVVAPLSQFPNDSSSVSTEEAATWRLRREMMHWLSLGPFSRSEVIAHVDMKLVEQVRQMPRHEWYLLEEEEIVGHVLESAGEYDDPCGGTAGTSADGADMAAALGYGMKMSGSWRLKRELWREITPLFECFSPSEAQLCEQNLRKELMRQRVRLEDSCVVPVPDATGINDEHFASARALGWQLLNSSSLFSIVLAIINNWCSEDQGGAMKSSERRSTSESLLVTAIHCLSVAVRLLEEDAHNSDERELGRADRVFAADDVKLLRDYNEAFMQHSGLFAKLCAPIEGSGGKSLLTLLSALDSSTALSPDTRALAKNVVEEAVKKSEDCQNCLDETRRLADASFDSKTKADEGNEQASPMQDKQQLAKEMMRRRQQEIMEKMRSQQLRFLSAQSGTNVDDDDAEPSSLSRAFGQGDGEDSDDDCEDDGDDDEACLSTEYEEEDDAEDDEWGFPTGHIKLELYLSHFSSAISLISERERRSKQRSQRRLRRRTKSKVRADSIGSIGGESAGSPSLTAKADPNDEVADEEECALCRLPCESHGGEDSTFGYVAMIQPTGLPQKMGVSAEATQLPPVPWTSVTHDTAQGVVRSGDPLIWSCGHVVHHACIKAYIDSLWKQQRNNRNPLEALHHGDDRLLSERELEFLCPVCRRLSNCLMPDVKALLRSRKDGPSGSLLSTRDQDDGELPVSQSSFNEWLASGMQTQFLPSFTRMAKRRNNSIVSDDSVATAAAAAVGTRVAQFCKQLKHRTVRAALQLPLLLAGGVNDELVADAELRHITDMWGLQFTSWQLLLRSLEVEIDVTLYERGLNNGAVGVLPERARLQSLRLLSEISVAAAASQACNDDDDDGHESLRSDLDDHVAATSDVLFGRRVLFAEDDDGDDEASDETEHGHDVSTPMLLHSHLFSVFSERLTARIASTATRCASLSTDYRYSEELLCDAFFTARTVVTAQVLQALCSAVVCLPPLSPEASLVPRSPTSPRKARGARVISDFNDVETLSDALEWSRQLMVRCRLVPVTTSTRWDMNAVEDHVVSRVLPLLRRVVMMIQASLPRVLDEDDDPCALCDELYQQQVAVGSKPRQELRALLRKLHLPPLRLFFRQFVFSPQQRELCQSWAAQVESKAAVLRRRGQASCSALTEALTSSGVQPSRLFIDLPKVYMDLFIKYNDKPQGVCQRCHQVPQHPAICLFCGDVLCCFSPCCEASSTGASGAGASNGRIGECTQHSQTCGLGTGAFLLLRACTVILFLGNERRCVWGSLYVDKNGEEDPYLRRGKTLLLAANRLRALETLLVSHGFTQNTAILANTSRRDGRRY